MARTTSAAVIAVLQGDYDSESAPSLTPFIETAGVMVDEAAGADVLSAARLELVERWLAAHYYCMGDRPYTSRSTGGASGSFAGQFSKGLESTPYGQTALALSGGLLAATGRRRAGAEWLGKTASEALTWDERN